ncbi:hypothetical protein FACS1894106_4350 [Spirochaetia bacterium]|nr:hypothetical protein FACS1894106_4350 [Spirochaetia bacterium]
MKKLSISKAIIGLFVVLAVGIGFAACEVGEYVLEEAEVTGAWAPTDTTGTRELTKIVVKLESGKKVTVTKTITSFALGLVTTADSASPYSTTVSEATTKAYKIVDTETGTYVLNDKTLTATLDTYKSEYTEFAVPSLGYTAGTNKTEKSGVKTIKVYRLEGKSLVPIEGVNVGNGILKTDGTPLIKKSLVGEEVVVELELADDLSAEELKALGL